MNGRPYLRVQAVFVLSSLGDLLTAINWPGRRQAEGGLQDIDPLLARSQTQQSQRDERCCQSHSTPLDTERNGKVRITEREGHARAGTVPRSRAIHRNASSGRPQRARRCQIHR